MAKPNTLPEWLSKYHTIKSGRSKMLYCTLEYLQEFGLTRLGFWGGGDIFVSCDDTAVQYNSEDEKIFSNLTPDFELDLSGGSYIGVIIAQKSLTTMSLSCKSSRFLCLKTT